jgi:peroxiredoxin
MAWLENTVVPAVRFKVRVESDMGQSNSCEINPSIWGELTTEEIFAHKKVIMFSLPGAFTPTCSTYQLPGFEEKAQEFYDKGVDEIYCCSVNDSFVMNAWRDVNNLENVKVLPDGNGLFTKEMGMLTDMSAVGFNMRSKRYAMIVDNGIITKMLIEPDSTPEDLDPYGESSPENVLKYMMSS